MTPLIVAALWMTPPPAADPAPPSSDEVMARAGPEDWRPLDPDNTLYMELDVGRIVMELAPHFAPATVENIKTLVRAGYFDGTTINRVQENYVVQWGDAAGEKPLGMARETIPPEFVRERRGDDFAVIDQRDTYAPTVGVSRGFKAAQDGRVQWLTHCYASLGVGRGEAADSGNGSELYVVIGHAPRHLDRNITLAGRVIEGMEHLSTLPRGTETLGFYAEAEESVPIRSVRLAAGVPVEERSKIEIMRTDTPLFRAWVEARAHRARDGWFLTNAGAIDLCNIPVPTRQAADAE